MTIYGPSVCDCLCTLHCILNPYFTVQVLASAITGKLVSYILMNINEAAQINLIMSQDEFCFHQLKTLV